jgi:hypothetical protein
MLWDFDSTFMTDWKVHSQIYRPPSALDIMPHAEWCVLTKYAMYQCSTCAAYLINPNLASAEPIWSGLSADGLFVENGPLLPSETWYKDLTPLQKHPLWQKCWHGDPSIGKVKWGVGRGFGCWGSWDFRPGLVGSVPGTQNLVRSCGQPMEYWLKSIQLVQVVLGRGSALSSDECISLSLA